MIERENTQLDFGQGSKVPHKKGWKALYTFTCKDKDGNIKWTDQGYNALLDEGESQILDIIFRGASAPTYFYLGLGASSTPAETDGLTDITEITGSGYSRYQVNRNNTDFPTLGLDSGDYQVESATFSFNATGSWTAATYLFLTDIASGTTGGSLWAFVALSTTRTLTSGDQLDVSLNVKLQ